VTDETRGGGQQPSGDQESPWKRRFDRERAARQEAEALLHDKSREVYLANEALKARAAELTASMESLEAAKDALVRQEKLAALGGLVAGVAHEINTPLGVSLTALSIIQEQVDRLRAMVTSGRLGRASLEQLIAKTEDSTKLAVGNMQRAASLVRSFKMVAIDQSTTELRTTSLRDLVLDIVSSISPLLKPVGAEVAVDVPERVDVRVDAGAIGQVLTNIVHNACIHAFPGSPRPPRIDVTVSRLPEGLRMVVRDNGLGMATDVVGRAWEPFFTTKRNQGGSGLGLHIVHNLVVERFGGLITLDTTLDEGCTFTIDLPFGTPFLQRDSDQ